MIGESSPFPRLVYLSDIPVEASRHSSTLFYRLLQQYPPDRLLIVEAGLEASQPERRLPGVRYLFDRLPAARLQTTRFYHWYNIYNILLGPKLRRLQTAAEILAFCPEAILTLTCATSWLVAAAWAQRFGWPLHLVCHDEWADSGIAGRWLQPWMRKTFGRSYRAAASRLCVSPAMVDFYQERYGAGGDLLYPSRAREAPVFDRPPERLSKSTGPLQVAYAGSIGAEDHRRALVRVAESLEPLDGRLLLFGPGTVAEAQAGGWYHPRMTFRGQVPWQELIVRLRAEADLLFIPMSFLESDLINRRISFPSKLTDCTATGLPLLVAGPDDCSAVRWARENKGVAEVLTVNDSKSLTEVLTRLAADRFRLVELGQRALDVGARDFSYDRAWEIFRCAVCSPPRPVTGRS